MFPDGYAANLARGASLEKLKIIGLKSHDWHIWLERVMPMMLRGYIPEEEWLVLVELSYFFRVLCAKELSDGLLEDMEDMVPELLCNLEKIFPPGFFNPLQHLILNLPTEARLGGPMQNFVTTHYEAKNHHLHNPKPRYNTGDPQWRQSNLSLFKGKLGPVGASRNKILDIKEWRTRTLYILTNLTEV